MNIYASTAFSMYCAMDHVFGDYKSTKMMCKFVLMETEIDTRMCIHFLWKLCMTNIYKTNMIPSHFCGLLLYTYTKYATQVTKSLCYRLESPAIAYKTILLGYLYIEVIDLKISMIMHRIYDRLTTTYVQTTRSARIMRDITSKMRVYSFFIHSINDNHRLHSICYH